ncbi:MAG: hypothetical protein AAGE89_04245 [Pseudomonadota bacterium]
MTNGQSLARAVKEVIGFDPGPVIEKRLRLDFENGRRLEFEFDQTSGQLTITTPVDGVHRGVPTPILKDLLRRNAADGGLAGGSLRVRAHQDYLEIANVVPLSLDAFDMANIALNQVNAADALVNEVKASVINHLTNAE